MGISQTVHIAAVSRQSVFDDSGLGIPYQRAVIVAGGRERFSVRSECITGRDVLIATEPVGLLASGNVQEVNNAVRGLCK